MSRVIAKLLDERWRVHTIWVGVVAYVAATVLIGFLPAGVWQWLVIPLLFAVAMFAGVMAYMGVMRWVGERNR